MRGDLEVMENQNLGKMSITLSSLIRFNENADELNINLKKMMNVLDEMRDFCSTKNMFLPIRCGIYSLQSVLLDMEYNVITMRRYFDNLELGLQCELSSRVPEAWKKAGCDVVVSKGVRTDKDFYILL